MKMGSKLGCYTDGDLETFQVVKKGETINYNINSKCIVGQPLGK